MTTAIPRPMVMPLRPPKYCPITIRNSVRATSSKVVRKTLMVSFQYSTRELLALKILLIDDKTEQSPSVFHTPLEPRCGRRLFCWPPLEAHCILLSISVDNNVIARQHLTLQNLQRQRILNQPLKRTPQRPCAISRVVALA